MMHLFLLLLFTPGILGLGCMVPVCSGNEKNELRRCPDIDGSCGNYHSERSNGQIVNGVDIRCKTGSPVKAPFDGQMLYWRPFGGAEDKRCADEGVRIEGTGQWLGYSVHISSIRLHFFGGPVKAGEEIGTARDRHCFDDKGQQDVEPHIQMKLYREGRLVDPSYHLHNCMCTGQICESNSKNRMLGDPFKTDKRYNGVRGWDIECRLVDEPGEGKRSPLIYAPITGEFIGRTRLTYDADGGYSGCENDGIFIQGTEDWIEVGSGFEVRMYNVRARADLGYGRLRVVQGEPVGMRLSCDNSPDSIFLEMRYQGRLVDVSDLITAKKCQLPSLPDLF